MKKEYGTGKKEPPHSSTALRQNGAAVFREKYYPGRAVAGRTFDPHYRSETVEEIPPSSEGVAFKPATCASWVVFIGRKT